MVAVVFSGADRYFFTISRVLQYSFEATLLGSAVLVLFANRRLAARSFAWPFAVWVLAYYSWGYLVSPRQTAVASAVTSAIVLNLLLVLAVAAAVSDRRRLAVFAWIVQIPVVVNCLISIWELHAPALVDQLALTLNPFTRAYSEARPAGLWAEPNDAAIAFLFALVISWWAPGPRMLVWTARGAAVVGIFLSASRSGLYPAVAVVLILAIDDLRRVRVDPLLVPAIASMSLAVAAVGAWIVVPMLPNLLTSVGVSPETVPRLLDYTQSFQDYASRGDVARLWLSVAINGPVQGSGVFSFQGDSFGQGAHDVFIMILGETGFAGLAVFLALWLVAISESLMTERPGRRDAVGIAMYWIAWIVEGLTSHNQFTSVTLIIISILLFQIPFATRSPAVQRTGDTARPALDTALPAALAAR